MFCPIEIEIPSNITYNMFCRLFNMTSLGITTATWTPTLLKTPQFLVVTRITLRSLSVECAGTDLNHPRMRAKRSGTSNLVPRAKN